MEQDKIMRCITSDGSLMAMAIDSGNIVHTAQCIHHTSPVATAALGRFLTAASMMGAMLKKRDAVVTLKINGKGPLGTVTAISDSFGNCRGSVGNPGCEMPNRANGKLDVGGAVGTNGMLAVIRDLGQGDPYISQTEIVSGELAEDITAYYAKSEQIPTVCALGVLLDKEDHKVLLAGGLLIQALPGADDAILERLEQNVAVLEPVTTMLAKGFTVEEICRKALQGFEVEVLDQFDVGYACPCNKERLERALVALGPEEIVKLADESSGIMEATCQYCGRRYTFTQDELDSLAKSLS